MPSPQILPINSGNTPIPFTISSNVPWLTVSPSSGTTPGPVTLTYNFTGLTPGSYTGTLTVSSPDALNSPQPSTFTLAVSRPTLFPSSSEIAFNYQFGSATPPSSQTFQLNSSTAVPYTAVAATVTGGNWLTVTPAGGRTQSSITITANPQGVSLSTDSSTIAFTAQAVSGQNWLTVTPTLGTTPAKLTVTASSQGLAPAIYNGLINITAPEARGSRQSVAVTFAVGR